MAIFTYDESPDKANALGRAEVRDLQTFKPDATPAFSQTLGAQFRTNNIIGSLLAGPSDDAPPEIDLSFNGRSYFNEIGLGNYADVGAETRNRAHADIIAKRVRQQLEDRRIIDESGFGTNLVTGAAAIVADPTTIASLFIPGGALVRGGGVVGNALARGGIEAATTLVQEAGLQATQETRSVKESAANVALSAIVGTVLGGAVEMISPAQRKALEDGLAVDLNAVPPTANRAGSVFGPGSVGAAEAAVRNDLVGTGGLAQLTSNLQLGGASLRAALSESAEAQRLGQELFSDNFIRQGAEQGIATATSVTLERRAIDSDLVKVRQALKDATRTTDTALAGDEAREVVDAARRVGIDIPDGADVGGYLTPYNIRQLATDAIRNGLSTPVNAVRRYAEAAKRVLDDLGQRAVNAGLIPPEKMLTNYVPRMYKVEQIIDNRAGFERDLKAAIQDKYQRMLDEGRVNPENRGRVQDIVENVDDELDIIVSDITDKLLGTSRGGHDAAVQLLMAEGRTGPRGSALDRVLDIDERLISRWLENDMEVILNRYANSMVPQISMMEKFGTLNFDKVWQDRVAPDFALMRDKVKGQMARKEITEEAGNQQLDRLAKQESDLKSEMAYGWNRLLGSNVFAASTTAGKALQDTTALLRKAAYPVYMGAQLISSLPDLGRLVFVHGMSAPLSLMMKKLSPTLRKLTQEQAREIGAGAELFMSGRIAAMSDLSSELAQTPGLMRKFDSVLDTFNEYFTKATGIMHWTSFLKDFSSTLAVNEVLKLSKVAADGGWDALKKNEKQYLTKLGIGKNDVAKLADQYAKFGAETDGFRVARLELWDDRQAARLLKLAALKDADTTINTPVTGSLPSWMEHPGSKLVFQFMTFAMASHQQTFLAGLQQRDAKAFMGVLTMVGLGGLTTYLRQVGNGKEPDKGAQFVLNAVDRSGVLGLGFNAYQQTNLAAQKWVGFDLLGKPVERFQARQGGDVLGPAAGAAFGTLDTLAKVSRTDQKLLSEKTYTQLTNRLPGQNLYGIDVPGVVGALTWDGDYFRRVNEAWKTNPLDFSGSK